MLLPLPPNISWASRCSDSPRPAAACLVCRALLLLATSSHIVTCCCRDLGCSHGKVRRGAEGGEGGIGLCCATMQGREPGPVTPLQIEPQSRWRIIIGVCVECLIGKQKKPILFKVTEPSSVPYRAPSACAKCEGRILKGVRLTLVNPRIESPLSWNHGTTRSEPRGLV